MEFPQTENSPYCQAQFRDGIGNQHRASPAIQHVVKQPADRQDRYEDNLSNQRCPHREAATEGAPQPKPDSCHIEPHDCPEDL